MKKKKRPSAKCIKNLIPIRNHEDAVTLGRKAGIASGHARAKQKTIKTLIKYILNENAKGKLVDQLRKELNIKEKKLTYKEAIIFAQLFKAIKKGDTCAFNAIVERIEGKPESNVKIDLDPKPFIIKTPKEDIVMGVDNSNNDE